MSVINKKPYAQSVLDTLSAENISSLKTLLNGASTTLFRSFINNSNPITASDKGVSHCVLEAKNVVFTGYLIFNNSYCVLFAYQEKSQKMQIVELDYENSEYSLIEEELSIEELRRIIEDKSIEAGDVEGYVTEDELPEKVESGIEQSLLNGSLKTALQSKALGVSEFPLTSDIDNQHSVVNAGLLPNGDMSDLTESDIEKLTFTLNRIINKGWLKTGTSSAIRLSSVIYGSGMISIVASNVVFTSTNTMLSGASYKVFLDTDNASYEYAQGSYSSQS